MTKRCPYCGARLADDGFCSKPCKPGELARKVAKAQEDKQTSDSSENK